MPVRATLLLLVSAFTHATWNLLTKRSAAPLAALWWTLLGGTLLTGLRTTALSGGPGWPPQGTGGLLVLSGLSEALYLYALSRAYQCGELGLTYPISRGSAPAMVALWSALLFGERLPWGGYLGLGLCVAGIILSAANSWGELARPLTAWGEPAARWALLSGFGISVFSLVDKQALRYFTPDGYNFWSLLAMEVALAPVALWAAGRRELLATLGREWRSIAVGSVLVPLTGLLVLEALKDAPASYVSGLRGLSVPAGALLARLVLSERAGPVRAAAGALLTAGTCALAWAG